MAAEKAGPYDDILELAHHEPARHPRMPLASRAAQFAPFAALTGHDDAIRETARLTDRRIEPDEYEKERTDRALRYALEHPGTAVRVTYFVPDGRKDGGAYADAAGVVKRLDRAARALVLADGRRIPVEEILTVELCPAQEADGSG